MRLWLTACRLALIASLMLSASALSPSDATAQTPEALQRGCDRGVAAACAYLGFMYAKGDGVRQDNSKAVELYTKACDGGHAG